MRFLLCLVLGFAMGVMFLLAYNVRDKLDFSHPSRPAHAFHSDSLPHTILVSRPSHHRSR